VRRFDKQNRVPLCSCVSFAAVTRTQSSRHFLIPSGWYRQQDWQNPHRRKTGTDAQPLPPHDPDRRTTPTAARLTNQQDSHGLPHITHTPIRRLRMPLTICCCVWVAEKQRKRVETRHAQRLCVPPGPPKEEDKQVRKVREHGEWWACKRRRTCRLGGGGEREGA